jgi:hypothetical protein
MALRSALLALLAPAALLVVPAAASATAQPHPKTMYEDHVHQTHGNDWHVQLQANDAGTGLTSLVLYAEACDENGLAFHLPVHSDGSFGFSGRKLNDGKGSWSIDGKFTDSDHAIGTWSVYKGACSVVNHPFAAHDGHGHFIIGNPDGYAPPRIDGNSYEARHLRSLQAGVLKRHPNWNTRAKVKKLGYVMDKSTHCPGLHHARKHGTSMWGNLLDPSAPQSFVFWCDSQERWTLAAAMFRASAHSTPPVFNNMIQWHKHGSDGTWMTHIWFVNDPVAAFAACAPFPAFERAGWFSYEYFRVDIPIDQPCKDTVTGSG